jgi:acetyltransferase-like isoleucine patch superfamily enzyme
LNIAKTITDILWENIVSKFAGAHGAVQVGAYTYGNPKFIKTLYNRAIVGKFCSIADNVAFVDDDHPYRRVANYPLVWWLRKFNKAPVEQQKEMLAREHACVRYSPIVVGNDVWIGTCAIVLPGVKIDDGAIIGAGAVVTHDVPAYAVVVGVPAKILRYRFTQKQIEQLLKIAWWNWDCSKIAANVTKFYGDVDDFIKEFGTS